MTGLEALQSVQFVTVKGKRFAILDGEDWDTLIDWLEDREDIELAQQALAALRAAGGDRASAGWLRWDEVEGQLE